MNEERPPWWVRLWHWYSPPHPVLYEVDWEGMVRDVERAHGYERRWSWDRYDLPFWKALIAEVIRDAHEGHEDCDAEVFALSAEVEVYKALQAQGVVW
jgi:hypothetical protein